MSSNDKSKDTKPAKKLLSSLMMTPRNLVPATPMRFSGGQQVNSAVLPAQLSKVKGPKKSSSLPPGYVDRAAQRREGLESNFNFEEKNSVPVPEEKTDKIQEKLQFLTTTTTSETTNDPSKLPKCSQPINESIMKLILFPEDQEAKAEKNNSSDFAKSILQFKSIKECKSQAFDPFYRPKRIYRNRNDSNHDELHDASSHEDLLRCVREAMTRLNTSLERHEKYIKTLTKTPLDAIVSSDIFPSVGRFDETKILENAINSRPSTTATSSGSKAKNRLFAAKKKSVEPEQVLDEQDVFDLIAQKSSNEVISKSPSLEHEGGLFGFSTILPKLSRLESNGNASNNQKLAGAYASILEQDNNNDEIGDEELSSGAPLKKQVNNYGNEDEESSLYPGYLEKEFSDDEEDVTASTPGNKRKLKIKEEKDAVKVEKLVKSKFGVDL